MSYQLVLWQLTRYNNIWQKEIIYFQAEIYQYLMYPVVFQVWHGGTNLFLGLVLKFQMNRKLLDKVPSAISEHSNQSKLQIPHKYTYVTCTNLWLIIFL